MNRLPDFLIIGAMKAGTTTLYRDLLLNPRVFMPLNKEPKNLLEDFVLTPEGLDAYSRLFERAEAGQICGEASTAYSKLPDHQGVPERAREVLGPKVRLVYIVREPVARIVSHHFHSYTTGRFGPNIDEEIRKQPSLLDYSRYAMQLRPWIETFGREAVLVVRFEDFVSGRRSTVAEISRFLGIEPATEEIDEERVFNKGDARPMRTTFWRKVRRSAWYQRFVQPRIPSTVRDRFREVVLPKGPARPAPPSDETIEFIYRELAGDMEELSKLVGQEGPLWPHRGGPAARQ